MQCKTNKPPRYLTINTKKHSYFQQKSIECFSFFLHQPCYRLGWFLLYIFFMHAPARARSQARFAHDASVHKNGWTRPLGRVLFFILLNRLTALLRRFVRLIKGPPKGWLTRSTYVPLFWKKTSTLSALIAPYSVAMLTQKLRLNFAPYSVANRLNFSRCSPAQKVVK